MRVLAFFLLFFAANAANAETSRLTALVTGNDARGWEAVGRVDMGNEAFCTGVLIAPDLVLTAAHCMFDKDTGRAFDVADMEFLAGLRDGRAEASRGVRRAVTHPDYVFTRDPNSQMVRSDLALLQLNQPIRTTRIEPFEVSTSVSRGTEIEVVSYARERSESASLQELCNVLGADDGVLVMDCAVDFGASGSPVFRDENGVLRLVSVVSSMADLDGSRVALGMDLAAPIAELRQALDNETGVFDTVPGQARVLRQGQRNDTGALFVRP